MIRESILHTEPGLYSDGDDDDADADGVQVIVVNGAAAHKFTS